MHAYSWSSAKRYLKKAIVSLLLLFFIDHRDQIVCGLQQLEIYKGSSAGTACSETKENMICKQQILKAGICAKVLSLYSP